MSKCLWVDLTTALCRTHFTKENEGCMPQSNVNYYGEPVCTANHKCGIRYNLGTIRCILCYSYRAHCPGAAK
jgi:hypothetical protein